MQSIRNIQLLDSEGTKGRTAGQQDGGDCSAGDCDVEVLGGQLGHFVAPVTPCWT